MSPFFSVVIPTLERAELLAESIESVLAQSFADFELVISDNCSKDRTADVCKRYSADSRVRVIRPNTWKNMPDHWEFATRQARGAYVAVLTDRHVMRPSALEFLHTTLSRQADDGDVLCWYDDSPFDPTSGIVKTHGFSRNSNTLDAREVLVRFANCDIPRTMLPHALNSCYRAKTGQMIRSECGRLFFPVSPDYTSAFLLLAYVRQVHYIDRPLYVSQAVRKLSTGYKSAFFGGADYAATLGNVDLYSHVPLKIDCTTNALLNDLLVIKDFVKSRLDFVQINMQNYLVAIHEDLLRKERSGSPLNLCAAHKQWLASVMSLSTPQRLEVERRAATLQKTLRRPWAFVLRYAGKLGVLPLAYSVAGSIRRVRHLLAGGKVFRTALEAARATNAIVRSD